MRRSILLATSRRMSGGVTPARIYRQLALVGFRHSVIMQQLLFRTESTCRASAERDQTGQVCMRIPQLTNTKQVQIFLKYVGYSFGHAFGRSGSDQELHREYEECKLPNGTGRKASLRE